MHFHLVNVNVVQRAQWKFLQDGTADTSSGKLEILTGTERPPDDNELGWKETVRMNPGEVTTVAMKFDLPVASALNPEPPGSPRFDKTDFAGAAEYLWHCHILEHEEHDMMHPVLVIPKGAVAQRRNRTSVRSA